jgi:exopolysaccharide production protein ExoQ
MMKLNNQLLNLWVRNLEVVATVMLLVYFLGLNLPSPLLKLMNILSYPIIAILIGLHWKRFSWVATRDILLLLLIGIAYASVFWSADLDRTLGGCRGLLRTFLFGAYLTTRYTLKEQLKILAWVFAIGAILSLVLILAIPSYANADEHLGAWQGVFTHKNVLGYAMTLGAILSLIFVIKKQKLNWLAWSGFCLTVALVVLARSSSALVTLLSLLLLMPIYKLVTQRYKLRVILLSMTCILAFIGGILIFHSLENILVNILREGVTFNGRTPIWSLIIEKTWEKPWLGYGYNAFWQSDAGVEVILNTWAPNDIVIDNSSFNAHNGYMELLPQLGFIGISLYAMILARVFFKAFILLLFTKKIEFFWLLQFLVFMSVANIGDVFVSILGTNSYACIYISVCLSTAVEWKRIVVNKQRYVKTNINQTNRIYYSNSKSL